MTNRHQLFTATAVAAARVCTSNDNIIAGPANGPHNIEISLFEFLTRFFKGRPRIEMMFYRPKIPNYEKPE